MAHKITAPKEKDEFRFVVAGGSYAAIASVKILTSCVIPKLLSHSPRIKKVSLIIIAPNREAYWNIASVRLIVDRELLATHSKDIFHSLKATLKQHIPPDCNCSLEVIQGKVNSIEAENNTLTYLKLNDEGLTNDSCNFFGEPLSYDILILATGASSSSPAFKLNGSSEISKRALKNLHDSVIRAKTIAVVGAGSVGVELAGELSYKYGKTKKITLYSEYKGALHTLKPKIGHQAAKRLKEMGVDIILNTRAVAITKQEDLSTRIDGKVDLNRDDRTFQGVEKSQKDLLEKHIQRVSPLRTHRYHRLKIRPYHSTSSTSNASNNNSTFSDTDSTFSENSTGSSSDPDDEIKRREHSHKTVVTFEDGSQAVYDCCIPTTGNIPNTQYLPFTALDDDGYILTDEYLRMRNENPQKNIYVMGDLIADGLSSIYDITLSQKQTLKTTLFHDLIDHSAPLKKYEPSEKNSIHLIAVSKKAGVGSLYGFSVPSFLVSWVKSKNFGIDSQASKFLE